MTLTGFLAARLDEDEATAHYAGPARVAWLTYRDDAGQMRYTTVAAGEDDAPWVADGHELPEPASARVVYDPARVLRQVQAGRKILASQAEPYVKGHVPPTAVLKCLALIWSDHPDYQQEWSPA